MEPSNDISCSLGDIRKRLSAPICSTLLEIQKYPFSKAKSMDWISNLECLSIPPKAGRKRRCGGGGEFVEVEQQNTVLRRCKINPFEERDYIAVSWACAPEAEEELAEGGYLIESRVRGEPPTRSEVRDNVLKRVIKYARHKGGKRCWIDAISIHPDDKQAAIQAMDLVYSLSQNSLAIINRHIGIKNELYLLRELMKGRFLKPNGDLSMPYKAGDVLGLIKKLTSASWWMRAWTFQEDYKASWHMVLLISHDTSLERLKRSNPIFGTVPGELCVKSTDFRTEVTKFCQAYQRHFRCGRDDMKTCNKILKRAGKYTIILQEEDEDGGGIIRKPMAPTILADIGARQITRAWDRLAIVANCSSYDVRLDDNRLRDCKFSQSLALLTQYLLNGEIINNGQSHSHVPEQNISDFLKNQSLDNFRSPVEKELTFIKSCRFTNVKLVNEGVQTIGHLWKVGKRIKVKCKAKLPWEDSTIGGLDGIQRFRLKQLAYELGTGAYGRRYKTLEDDLLSYLDGETMPKYTFAEQYKYWMAKEVFHAMRDRRKVLHLGCLVDGPNTEGSPYRGIFVCDVNNQGPEYIFTSYCQSKGNLGDIDKHVSLGVELLNPNSKGTLKLITKKWVNGLYFASGRDRRDVLFPWPEVFKI